MTTHFADRLTKAISDKKTCACVGFDPLIERLPPELRVEPGSDRGARAEAILAFGRGVIEAVAPLVPVVKINIAFFEPLYSDGIRIYHQLVAKAHQAGLIVIGDVKRADIGHTSARYAQAQLGDPDDSDLPQDAIPDAVTVNPYFGIDGVKPFIDVAHKTGRGVFVLVQTSNPSAAAVQGITANDGQPVCHHVARLVQEWSSAEGLIGDSGYSCVGAVVSPRDLESTDKIRAAMPNCLFLVPGFGAQGRTADEVARCFKGDGSGAVVNSSRGIIYAHDNPKHRNGVDGDWRRCIRESCEEFVGSIRSVLS